MLKHTKTKQFYVNTTVNISVVLGACVIYWEYSVGYVKVLAAKKNPVKFIHIHYIHSRTLNRFACFPKAYYTHVRNNYGANGILARRGRRGGIR